MGIHSMSDVISLLTICTLISRHISMSPSMSMKLTVYSIWNLLFWAIVLLTYIISPHGEVYLLEKCAMCSLNMMLCIAWPPLLLRGKLRCQLKLLKKVWIYSNNLWCSSGRWEQVSTQQRRHVSLYRFRWWCHGDYLC